MPFLAIYLVQIPSLLIGELFAGSHWLEIDFCIGKLTKEFDSFSFGLLEAMLLFEIVLVNLFRI